MLTPISFVCIDSTEVKNTPEVIREMFAEVAVIGHIYVHYHGSVETRINNPFWWANNGTQTVWISIREWIDSEDAFKTIKALNEGISFICKPDYSLFIPIEATTVADMLRFPIDYHSWPSTPATRGSLDSVFDSLPYVSREKAANEWTQYLNRRFVPINNTIQRLPIVDRIVDPLSIALMGLKFSFDETLSLVHPEDCLPSDRPYVIDAFELTVDEDLVDMNAHKRQRIEDASVCVYNLV